MTLHFPLWLAYALAIIVITIATLFLLWLVAYTSMACIQRIVNALKCNRAFVRFFMNSEFQRIWCSNVELGDELDETRRELGEQRHLAGWALYRLYSLTEYKVGESSCCVPDPETEQHLLAIVAPYQEQWDAWVKDATTEEANFWAEEAN